ncbi:MAG: thiamine-phosphate kinase [Chthoniobacterales bacterium]
MDSITLASIGEDALVQKLTASLSQGADVVLGPGHDCAAVECGSRKWLRLLKTDCIIEGVHFLPDTDPARIGWKALARAVSDIAAAGGEPLHALVTLAASPDQSLAKIEGIYTGLARAAAEFGVSIVGGDTARAPTGVFVSIAIDGRVRRERLATRSGGRPGDVVFVTGKLGGSIRGKHLDFYPRLAEAAWLTSKFQIRAMMDLSDGLGADLPRLADASGVGFEIDTAALPLNEGCSLSDGVTDGEDYELLFAIRSNEAEKLRGKWTKRFPYVPLSRIGRLLEPSMGRTPLALGFLHFSDCNSGGPTS